MAWGARAGGQASCEGPSRWRSSTIILIPKALSLPPALLPAQLKLPNDPSGTWLCVDQVMEGLPSSERLVYGTHPCTARIRQANRIYDLRVRARGCVHSRGCVRPR